MDITATLLNVRDRITLVQAIWDTISEEQVDATLTTAQQQELDRRVADYDTNPCDVLTWDEIKSSIRR